MVASIAAALFGLSTPAAKLLLSLTDPWLLAGLLYLGSGLGLGCWQGMLSIAGRATKEALFGVTTFHGWRVRF